MIEFLFLDLDDTILDFHKAERIALSKTIRQFGVEPTEEVLHRYHLINKWHWEQLEQGRLTREEVLQTRFGAQTPAVGFAAGLERLLMLMENTGAKFPEEPAPTVYLAGMDDACRAKAFEIAVALRKAGVPCEVDHMNRSIKAQFKYADKLKSKYVAVIGGNELAQGVMNVKNMSASTQESVPFDTAVAYFKR